jgi:hypothetical protein
MRKLLWLAPIVAALLLVACGRTAIVINFDVLSFIPESNRTFDTSPAFLDDYLLGPFEADVSGDLIDLVGITSGEIAVTIELTTAADSTLGMRVYLAPGGTVNWFDAEYELGAASGIAASAGVPAELALVLALDAARLEMLQAGSVTVGIRFESSAVTTATGEITLLRLTVRRDPQAT